MLWLILSLFLGHSTVCNSTIFGMAGDKYAGSTARYLRRPVDPSTDIGVAHRYLRLGSLVQVHLPRTGKTVIAVVIDRGPYGRLQANGSWINGAVQYRNCQAQHPEWSPLDSKCYSKGSRWRGGLDTTPELARLLGHDGWEVVEITPIRFLIIPRRTLLRIWGGGNV